MAGKSKLGEYRSKRDFLKTREPKGKVARTRKKSLSFCVQKHDATRLHYDFRLEWNGVLLSWAVTKGPSRDPSEKRLAIRTEDHPLDYGDFEGTIPDEEYGGGTVMLWDEGTWTPREDPAKGLKEGKLSFELQGERMKDGWALVRMKGRGKGKRENWLLVKERDEGAGDDPDELTRRHKKSVASGRTMKQIAAGKGDTASRKKTGARKEKERKRKREHNRKRAGSGSDVLPEFRKPQLATLTDEVPDGEGWVHEPKLDGYRCLAAVAGDRVRCYTRSGLDWTEKFGSVAEALRDLDCRSALIDGEIVAAASGEGSQFSALQQALRKGEGLAFYVFDLLVLDGDDLRQRSLLQRKEKLERLVKTLPSGAPVVYCDHVQGHGRKVFAAMCRKGLEGILAKKADAPYRGERTRSWLKVKCTRRQEFVVGGFSPSDKAGRQFASLLIGTFDGGRLRYRGRVGTGFSAEDFDRLAGLFARRERQTTPFEEVPASVARNARWLRPDIVIEVDYAEFTNDGYVRHGSFQGTREDKKAASVKLEQPADPPGEKDMVTKLHGIRLTHADRVVYPGQGVTKSALARYYDAVADRMLEHAAGRPLSLLRCPKGIRGGGDGESCFFQKHGTRGFPDAVKRVSLREKSGKKAEYLYLDDVAGLVAAVQMGTLEFHIWGCRKDKLEKPDRLVFDLDPDEKVGFESVRLAARLIRERLQDLGLETVALATGGKGVHVIAPLRRTADWGQVKAFAKAFATSMAEEEPDAFTATMSKAKRRGRIFLDWLRNERGSTAIAPYSTRARKGAPVATPVAWDELESLDAANSFLIEDVIERLDDEDPWNDAATWTQSVTVAMLEQVGAE